MNVPAGGEAATPSPTGRGGLPSAVPIPDPDASRRRILTASPPDAPNPAAPAFAEGSRAPAFIGSQLPGDKKSWKSASPSKAAAAPPPCGHKPGRRRHRRRNAFHLPRIVSRPPAGKGIAQTRAKAPTLPSGTAAASVKSSGWGSGCTAWHRIILVAGFPPKRRVKSPVPGLSTAAERSKRADRRLRSGPEW